MREGGKPKALIAMSGGVDSSAAALLAVRAGYDCVGVTMALRGGVADAEGAEREVDAEETERAADAEGARREVDAEEAEWAADAEGAGRGADAEGIKWGADVEGAEQAAEKLGIKHLVLDYKNEFRSRVVEPFVSSYETGKTPNPCITCNTDIKFGLLYDYAVAEGFDKLVTGHYARIIEDRNGSFRLARASYAKKDQSYFLYGIPKEKLGHLLFPLGELTKKDVRAIAAEAGLENADKGESQDICFVPNGDHAEFIIGYRGSPSAAGNFVDTHGRILGRHSGIERYTIGQRRGLGLAVGHPIFVKEIRPETREVVLADEYELFVSHINIATVNLFSEVPKRAEVMIRYNAKPARAGISAGPDGSLIAEFDEPVRAPAKGQAAVLYDGDYVIGGGRIEDIWQ